MDNKCIDGSTLFGNGILIYSVLLKLAFINNLVRLSSNHTMCSAASLADLLRNTAWTLGYVGKSILLCYVISAIDWYSMYNECMLFQYAQSSWINYYICQNQLDRFQCEWVSNESGVISTMIFIAQLFLTGIIMQSQFLFLFVRWQDFFRELVNWNTENIQNYSRTHWCRKTEIVLWNIFFHY